MVKTYSDDGTIIKKPELIR